jgi:outer membrane lipoprotein-sorting protein
MKKTVKKFFQLLCCLSLVLIFSSCEQEGPAEKAGENIDEAMETSREKLEEAGEKIEETVEKGGEKIEEAGEKMQD